MSEAGGIKKVGDSRLLFSYQSHPRNIELIKSPSVLKGSTSSLAANGSGVVAVGVEGRVKVDKVYTLGVHAPQYVQVVRRP